MKTYAEWQEEFRANEQDVSSTLFSALKDLVAQCSKWAPSIDRSMAEYALRQAQQMGVSDVNVSTPAGYTRRK